MPTPIDDLSEGKYIAIVGFVHRKFRDEIGEIEEPRWDGTPLKILSISLPFLAVWDGERRFALDMREIDVQVVSKKYAESLLYGCEKTTTSKKPLDEPDARDCPRCRERLRQKLITHDSGLTQGLRIWHMHCASCGFDGGDSETYLERLADAKAKHKTRKRRKGNDGNSVPTS